jgi:hypothetical protein
MKFQNSPIQENEFIFWDLIFSTKDGGYSKKIDDSTHGLEK